ncbi:hypothetical protein BS78_03G127400 [Paspalum vaginatum]|nr:hypothetical protein BS78_03G127400 [Paspalum vaginatum]
MAGHGNNKKKMIVVSRGREIVRGLVFLTPGSPPPWCPCPPSRSWLRSLPRVLVNYYLPGIRASSNVEICNSYSGSGTLKKKILGACPPRPTEIRDVQSLMIYRTIRLSQLKFIVHSSTIPKTHSRNSTNITHL